MDKMSNGLINVIVVTRKNGDYLASCLKSVSAQTYHTLEVSVIDNSQKNLFYCQALNQGIAKTSGEFVLCLNDDVILEPTFVEEALKGFALNSDIGMVSGKILRMDKQTLDSTGLFLTCWRTAKERGYGKKDYGQFDKPGHIFGVNGAVAFYRRRMLDEIKINGEYFDQDFRIFYEDLDIAWRAQRFGWKGYYLPKAIACHVRGGTVRKEGGVNKKHARRYIADELYVDLTKNRYLTIIKNETLLKFILFFPFIIAYDLLAWAHVLFFRPRLLKKLIFSIIFLIPAFKKRLFHLEAKDNSNFCKLIC
ncbi:glycosyltransferase [bacterium]|nr:MAG: glycosyltransferase [bacterium]